MIKTYIAEPAEKVKWYIYSLSKVNRYTSQRYRVEISKNQKKADIWLENPDGKMACDPNCDHLFRFYPARANNCRVSVSPKNNSEAYSYSLRFYPFYPFNHMLFLVALVALIVVPLLWNKMAS